LFLRRMCLGSRRMDPIRLLPSHDLLNDPGAGLEKAFFRKSDRTAP
jgi:hypothetical protein